ncbi:uncharacterized protein [Diadema antillarum]|uniref:uncharacterized protein n=1 Tax=Diadema antillarum TaxID=105358 RepID=UPI003A875980
MATNFCEDDNTDCEGCHSKTKSHITYRREVRERLCDDCARERQDTIKGVARKVKWFCDKHDGDEAKLYCKSHEIPICLACALTTNHEACQKHDIQDVKTEKRDQLMKMLQEGQAKKENIASFEEDVSQHHSHINSHLRMIERQIKGKEEKDRKSNLREMDEKRVRINREADENIREINEERKKRLEQVENDAKESNNKGKRNAEALSLELGKIKDVIDKCIVKLQTELRDRREEINGAIKTAEDLIIEEERLPCDISDVTSLLNQGLTVNVENINQIRQQVERIKFKTRKGLRIGKLDGMQEKCVLHGTWKQSDGTECIGAISNHEVMLTRNNALYVANIKTRTITPVKIPGIDRVEDLRIARLDDFRLVVTSQASMDYSLKILHRHSSNPDSDVIAWRPVRTIDTCELVTFLHVDKNGLILTVLWNDSIIHIYNPENGKLVQTVNWGKGIEKHVFGLSSMSSGLICVLTYELIRGERALYVVNRLSGIESTITFNDYNSSDLDIAVDESDDIYLTYYNSIKKLYVVDVLSSTGVKISEAIIECPGRPKLVTTLPKRFTVFNDCTIYRYERKSLTFDCLNALMP